MTKILFALPGNENLGKSISTDINAEYGDFELRHFPDGESYIRMISEVRDKEAIVVCTLNHPNQKILLLLFLCNLLKEMGARSICLVAPYLAYMRQDKKFKPGEAVTSAYFAKLISYHADQLITIDPHLHRRHSMNEIYSIPCTVLHASQHIGHWVNKNIQDALLVGPDSESKQWVSEIAKTAQSPYIILDKIRFSDTNVQVSIPEMNQYKNYTPVIIDDIISTAQTMIEAAKEFKKAGMQAPICIGVHAIFAENAYDELLEAGAAKIISCNTIQHKTNAIDISKLISDLLNGPYTNK